VRAFFMGIDSLQDRAGAVKLPFLYSTEQTGKVSDRIQPLNIVFLQWNAQHC